MNHENKNEQLVSIIIPTYNSSTYIRETLKSVISQTYLNWEVFVVDDFSTDDTEQVVQQFIHTDKRINYLKLDYNCGTAVARNKGIEKAKGFYIAFLDSDDLWSKDKLSKQIKFMESNNYVFSCTNYSKIDDEGNDKGIVIKSKEKMDYNQLLKNNAGNSTVIYNSKELGKFFIPDIRKRNDYVMWLQVIKKAKYLYGLDEVLAMHRIREGSLSKNKFSLLKYHWYVYRNIEKLPISKTVYLLVHWIFITVSKNFKLSLN